MGVLRVLRIKTYKFKCIYQFLSLNAELFQSPDSKNEILKNLNGFKGFYCIVFYALDIFQSAGIAVDANMAAILTALFRVIGELREFHSKGVAGFDHLLTRYVLTAQ